MKKLISFLVSSIFVFTSYAQVHKLLRANIKDPLVIETPVGKCVGVKNTNLRHVNVFIKANCSNSTELKYLLFKEL